MEEKRRVGAEEVVVDAQAHDERAAGQHGEEVGEVLRDQLRRFFVGGEEHERKSESEDDGQPAQPRRGAEVQLARAGMIDGPRLLGHALDDARGQEGGHAAGDEEKDERDDVLVQREEDSSSVAAGFSRPAEAGRYTYRMRRHG